MVQHEKDQNFDMPLKFVRKIELPIVITSSILAILQLTRLSHAVESEYSLPCAGLSYIQDFNPNRNEPEFDTVEAYALRKTPWKEIYSTFIVLDASDIINPVMKRTTEGEGMHFQVKTEFKLRLSEKLLGLKCALLFAEYVTSSFFIDLYELHRTNRNQVEYYYKENIDVEKTAAESSNHTLFVMSNIDHADLNLSYNLKWNIRYHSPSADSYYTNVTNYPPHVYITCRNPNHHNTNMCHQLRTKTNVHVGPFFDHSLALWLPIQYHGGSELVFSWPVGYTPHWALVTFVTLLTTFAGTCAICNACINLFK